jgi:hypothetical protein
MDGITTTIMEYVHSSNIDHLHPDTPMENPAKDNFRLAPILIK